jgi:hypothetical protein
MEKVLFEVNDQIATITINRPEAQLVAGRVKK